VVDRDLAMTVCRHAGRNQGRRSSNATPRKSLRMICTRRLHAEVIPFLDALRPARVCPWNSSSRPLGATVGLGSPNYCPETPAPHLAPAGPSSFLRLPACSTCLVRHPSRWRGRTRVGVRHCVPSPLGSSYCLCSRRVARRALMIRTRPSRAACATNSTRRRAERPIVISRSSPSE